MKKIELLSIALILVGFLSALAQINFAVQEQLRKQNAWFNYPDFENLQFPTLKKIKSGEDWWEPDTVYCFNNVAVRRYILEYNSQGLLAEKLEQWRENNSWENGYLYTYIYDSNHNLLIELNQYRENSSWVNNYSNTYTYDSNNNMLTRLWQAWENNSLKNGALYTFTYDADNNLLTAISVLYNIRSRNSWENFDKKTYTYDPNNNVLNELHQNWENNQWVNSD